MHTYMLDLVLPAHRPVATWCLVRGVCLEFTRGWHLLHASRTQETLVVNSPRAPASVNRLRSMRHASGMSPLAASAVQPCSQREDDRPKLRLAGALGIAVLRPYTQKVPRIQGTFLQRPQACSQG